MCVLVDREKDIPDICCRQEGHMVNREKNISVDYLLQKQGYMVNRTKDIPVGHLSLTKRTHGQSLCADQKVWPCSKNAAV